MDEKSYKVKIMKINLHNILHYQMMIVIIIFIPYTHIGLNKSLWKIYKHFCFHWLLADFLFPILVLLPYSMFFLTFIWVEFCQRQSFAFWWKESSPIVIDDQKIAVFNSTNFCNINHLQFIPKLCCINCIPWYNIAYLSIISSINCLLSCQIFFVH